MKPITSLSTRRAADIYADSLEVRRWLFDDSEFFKMPDAWAAICEESETWKTKIIRAKNIEDHKPKAGIVAFGDGAILTADERLIEGAKKGNGLHNFILAHEFGHLIADHHKTSGSVKNFQLVSSPKGMSVRPPNLEELEANLAAVFFQCGVALEDKRLSAIDLARRAFSDVGQVRMAQRYVQLDVFQRELHRPKPTYPRVVF